MAEILATYSYTALGTSPQTYSITCTNKSTCTKAIIPETYGRNKYAVTEIANNAFNGATYLKETVIHDGVNKVGSGAFYNCISLESIYLNSATIGDASVGQAVISSAKSVILGSNVKNINTYLGVSNRSIYYSFSLEPPVVADGNTFLVNPVKIYVPEQSVEAYKSATGWSQFADKIIGDDLALYFALNADQQKKYFAKKVDTETVLDQKLNNSGTDSFDGTLLLPQSSKYLDRSAELNTVTTGSSMQSPGIAFGSGEQSIIDSSLATITRITGDTSEVINKVSEAPIINFIDYYSPSGITITYNQDNKIIINGTLSSAATIGGLPANDLYLNIGETYSFEPIKSSKVNFIDYSIDMSGDVEHFIIYPNQKIPTVKIPTDAGSDTTYCCLYSIEINLKPGTYDNEVIDIGVFPGTTGIKNAKLQSFESIGYNKFDINTSIRDYTIDTNTGLPTPSPGYLVSDFIDISIAPEHEIYGYTLYNEYLIYSAAYVAYYDGNKQFLDIDVISGIDSAGWIWDSMGYISRPQLAPKYARISYSYEEWKDIMVYDTGVSSSPIVEYGDYYPYKQSKITFNDLELGKWDFIQDGKIYKHTLKIELDGSENWSRIGSKGFKADLTNKLNGKNFYGGDMYVGSASQGAPKVMCDQVICLGYKQVAQPGLIGSIVDGNTYVSAESQNTVAFENNLIIDVSIWQHNLRTLKEAGTPLIIYVHTINSYVIEDFPFANKYRSFLGGTEQLKFIDGNECSFTRYYQIQGDETEAANKGYVNTVAANKLDVNGGSMEGPLHLNDNLIISKETDVLGTLNVAEGTIMLPNSSQHQYESNPTLFNETEARITGGKNKSFKIIDGSNAEIVKITGDTIKSDPSIIYPQFSLSENDPGIDINSDGTITLKNNYELWSSGPFTIPYGKFLFVQMEVDPSWYDGDPNYPSYLSGIDLVFYSSSTGPIAGLSFGSGSDSNILTAEYYHYEDLVADSFVIRNSDGRDIKIKNIRIKMMDSDPDSDFILPPYTEPFDGLKHVEFSGVRSTGKNLINIEELLSDYLVRDPSDPNYFSFKYVPPYGSPYNSLKLFDTPRSIYAKVKYKQCDALASDDAKGIQFIFTREGSEIYHTLATYLNRSGEAEIYAENITNIFFASGSGGTNTFGEFMISLEDVPYEPYKEAIVKYDSPLKLGKWDYIQTGKLYRGTEIVKLDGSETEWQALGGGPSSISFFLTSGSKYNASVNNDSAIVSGFNLAANGSSVSHPASLNPGSYWFNPLSGIRGWFFNPHSYMTLSEWKEYLKEHPIYIAYQKETPSVENINKLNSYPAYENGTEQLLINSEEYGFNPSIEVVYQIEENPTEAATKGYVNNGLAKKLDTSGGLIQGSLQVDGTIQGKLSSIVVTNGETTYGLAYDSGDDTFKLGQGSYSDSEKVFEFKEGEGLPIALRDDDSKLTDNSLLKYSKDGNKLTDSGVKLDLLLKLFENLTLEQIEALNEFAKSLTLID